MKPVPLLLTVAVSSCLTFAGLGVAAHHPEPEEPPVPMFLLSKLASLGITDTQQHDIRGILKAHQTKVEPLLRDCVRERRALRELVRKEGPVDESAIRAQSTKLGTSIANLSVEGASISQDIRKILTPAQIQKLKEMQQQGDERIDHLMDHVANAIDGK